MPPPWLAPPRPSLAAVPTMVLDELARAHHGVVVLAVDGLGYAAALAAGWDNARLAALHSTFPSTSATAWLTALTGVGPEHHGVPANVYRVPGTGALVDAITGTVLARGPAQPGGDPRLVVPHPTVFDQAAAVGIRCHTLAREIEHLSGAWAQALLHGATRIPAPPQAELACQAADPARLAAAVIDEIDAALAVARDQPLLLWVYVNLDDHVHRHGYDAAAINAMRRLSEVAARWAEQGWTVVAHADHGQVPHHAAAELVHSWSDVDSQCLLPAGGAGRVRWLYPEPDRVDAVRAQLAKLLGDAVRLPDTAELAALGLPINDLLAGRVGAVVAVARDARFPVPDPALRWEHGGDSVEEMLVPFAVWQA